MNSTYDALVLLGRGLSEGSEPPDSVKANIVDAVKLYNQKVARYVIFSGKWSRSLENVPTTTEAQAMQKYAITLGLPESAIILEDESLDTISNWYFIKNQILIPRKWKSILFITVQPIAARAEFLMNSLLGPEYKAGMYITQFKYSAEKLQMISIREKSKLIKLKNFLRKVTPGDHETIMKMHLNYIKTTTSN